MSDFQLLRDLGDDLLDAVALEKFRTIDRVATADRVADGTLRLGVLLRVLSASWISRFPVTEFLWGRAPRSIGVNQWGNLRVITMAESAKFPFGAIRGPTDTTAVRRES